MKKCRNCGNEILDKSKFCTHCGCKIEIVENFNSGEANIIKEKRLKKSQYIKKFGFGY